MRPVPLQYVYKGPAQADVEWSKVRRSLSEFASKVQEVKRSWKGSLDTIESFSVGEGFPESALAWFRRNWPSLRERMSLVQAEEAIIASAQRLMKSVRRPKDFPEVSASHVYKELVEALTQYMRVLQSFFQQAGPRNFTYKGFKILNPDRMPDHLVEPLLGAISYVTALFKRRGVLPVLQDTVDLIVLRHQAQGEKAHGWYLPQKKEIHLLSVATAKNTGRMLINWVNEVFLHEVGHHIHLTLLHPRARVEWDSAWADVEDAEREAAEHMKEIRQVSLQERQWFWKLLLRAKGNLRVIKLKGIDRMKFHAWLRKPLMGGPFVTPKQLRWTKVGKRRIQEFLEDPERLYQHYAEYGGETAVQEQIAKHRARLEETLGVNGTVNGPYPLLTEDQVEEYRKDDEIVDAALDALEMPTSYARTNEREDFAETFVAFMADPGRLSKQARYRMKRALALSDLYGKTIMKLASTSRVARRWLQRKAREPVTCHTLELQLVHYDALVGT